jgi:hypothetical protein
VETQGNVANAFGDSIATRTGQLNLDPGLRACGDLSLVFLPQAIFMNLRDEGGHVGVVLIELRELLYEVGPVLLKLLDLARIHIALRQHRAKSSNLPLLLEVRFDQTRALDVGVLCLRHLLLSLLLVLRGIGARRGAELASMITPERDQFVPVSAVRQIERTRTMRRVDGELGQVDAGLLHRLSDLVRSDRDPDEMLIAPSPLLRTLPALESVLPLVGVVRPFGEVETVLRDIPFALLNDVPEPISMEVVVGLGQTLQQKRRDW